MSAYFGNKKRLIFIPIWKLNAEEEKIAIDSKVYLFFKNSRIFLKLVLFYIRRFILVEELRQTSLRLGELIICENYIF